MAITITDNFRLRSKIFIDERVNQPNVSALKNWDQATKPIPDGFEVCVEGGVWYVYNSANTVDPVLGKFRLKDQDHKFASGERVSSVYLSSERADIKPGSEKLIKSSAIAEALDEKQDNLVSGQNIKTVDHNSLVGPGNVDIKFKTGEKVQNEELSENMFDVNPFSDKIVKGKGVSGAILTAASVKQNTLIDQVNIKTINGESILGPGNLVIEREGPIYSTFASGQKVGDTYLKDQIIDSSTTIASSKAVYEEVDSHYALTFQSLLTPSNWPKPPRYGIIVTVTADPDPGKNGVYHLKGLNYTTEESWVKLFEPENMMVGIGNLLRNTSFLGNLNYDILNSKTSELINRSLYSDPYYAWGGRDTFEIVADSNSASGFSAHLQESAGSKMTQTPYPLLPYQTYTMSWKQKGKIKVTFGNLTFEHTTASYAFVYETFGYNAWRNPIVTFEGEGHVCEIKFGAGNVPTAWSISMLDREELPDRIKNLDYLKTAFNEYNDSENLASGVALRSRMESGIWGGGNDVLTTKAGVNGTYTEDSDPYIWTGGTIGQAQELITNIYYNPDYLQTITPQECEKLTKSALTFSSYSVFTSLVARGRFYDGPTGKKLGGTARMGKSGIVKLGNVYYKFANGLLTTSTYSSKPTLYAAGQEASPYGFSGSLTLSLTSTFYNPGTDSNVTGIKTFTFTNGIMTAAGTVKDVSGVTGIMKAEENLYLAFFKGLLVKGADTEEGLEDGIFLY